VRFTKEVSFDAPVERVFALIDDVEVLASCVPGLEQLTVRDERHFDSRVRMSIGPITGRFELTTSVEEIDAPHRIVLRTQGVDPRLGARVNQRQAFDLRPDGEGTTVVITTDLQVQGRLATFGQRVIGARADAFADEVAANVARILAVRG
jgi:uncharacterized protein